MNFEISLESFLSVAIKQRENEKWWGKEEERVGEKKLQNNIYKMKKACWRYVSITCNEIFIIGWCWKTCICLFAVKKTDFHQLNLPRKNCKDYWWKVLPELWWTFSIISIKIWEIQWIFAWKFFDFENSSSDGCENPKSIFIIKIFN